MFRNRWFSVMMVVTILASLLIAPLAISAQTENGITAPAADATVSGTVKVTGYAADANFLRWDLFILPGGNENAKAWIASSDKTGEFSVDLDTTKYPDGDHALSLRVVTNPRQDYMEYVTDFSIANTKATPAATTAATATPAATTAATTAATPAATPAATTAAPSNGLDVKADAVLAGKVDVTGYAADANFLRWDLFILPGGNENAKTWVASGDKAGKFTVSLDTSKYPDGKHTFSLRVVTNPRQDYMEYLTNFSIANTKATPAATTAATATPAATTAATTAATPAATPAATTAAPSNGLDVKADAVLAGTVDVTGYAADANFLRWDLFILPGGNENAKTWVASGDKAGKFTVSLDTSKYPDGKHTFSLRVVTNPRQDYMEYLTNFSLANAK